MDKHWGETLLKVILVLCLFNISDAQIFNEDLLMAEQEFQDSMFDLETNESFNQQSLQLYEAEEETTIIYSNDEGRRGSYTK